MSEITEKIAREHKDFRYGCKCGAEDFETHAAHVSEVTEAAVRAEIDETRPSPINGHEWRGQSDSSFSTICIHCGGWSGKVANSQCPTTVTPSREAVKLKIGYYLRTAIALHRALRDDTEERTASVETLIESATSELLALLPGVPRSEAEATRQWGRAFWTTNSAGEKVLFVDDQDGAFRDRADAAGMTKEAYDESPYDFVVFRDVTDWTISPRADAIERGGE